MARNDSILNFYEKIGYLIRLFSFIIINSALNKILLSKFIKTMNQDLQNVKSLI
jgi:hypothetical protein